MKLAPKIILGFAVSASLVFIVAIASYQAVESVRHQQESLVTTVMPNLQALQNIESSGLRIVAISSELIWMHALSSDAIDSHEWKEELKALQEEGIEPYDKAISKYRSISEKFVAHEVIFVELIDEWGSMLKQTSMRLVNVETHGPTPEQLSKAHHDLEVAERGFLLSIEAAKVHETNDLHDASVDLHQVLLKVENTIGVGSSLAFVVAILFGVIFARSLTRPIVALKNAAVALGNGDLNARVDIPSKDEVGTLATSFNTMGDALGNAAAVFENTSEGVVIADKDAKIIAVNKAFTDITGYEEAEVVGANPRVIKSDRHNESFYSEMWSQILEHGIWKGELWNRRKSGEVFPAWSSIRAIRDDHGEISHYISVFSDITSLKSSQEKVDFLAYHDPLTNLPNRLLFEDRLEHALNHARRAGHQVAVLFIDLDRFKNINDSLGHPIGDSLLIRAAERLSRLVRQEDTVARVGGDEFVIVIENVARSDEIASLATKLLEAFHKPIAIKNQDLDLHVTLSIGISVFPEDGEDVPTLVKNADAALYRAKEEGRNGLQFYTSELTSTVFERLELESALRVAVNQQALELYYQPLISMTTGEVLGAEALLRWNHPTLGVVGPDRFIPLAEDTGLINSIGEWVVHEACGQARRWLERGYEFGSVAVNVSGLQIQRGHYYDVVKEALKVSGLEGSRLVLEITENVIMQNTTKAISVLRRLKSLGACIAIDDFGTGYSSLSYLKQLPIDKLKIDRSFVRDMPVDANDRAIARAVTALAKSLHLRVVAEGIETAEQERLLRLLGCDEGQGYLYSKPVPVDDFEAILAGRVEVWTGFTRA